MLTPCYQHPALLKIPVIFPNPIPAFAVEREDDSQQGDLPLRRGIHVVFVKGALGEETILHDFGDEQDNRQQDQQQQLQQYPSVAYIDDLLRRCHVPVIRNLRERKAFVIDEDVTAEAKDHVVIHYGFNDELDRAKETFETLDGE